MYCDGCGAALQAGHAFCPQCAKQVKPGIHIAYPQPNRVQEHVRLLGILWLALSALNAVGGVVLFIIANTIFSPHRAEMRPGPQFLHPLLGFIAVVILMKAAAGFAAGWGLLQREPWARLVTLVVAFLALFNVPLGTALGIYSLWVLLPAASERQYEEQVRAA
jgi:phage shock protein PspC (stress-responsive transcriptional regulator)